MWRAFLKGREANGRVPVALQYKLEIVDIEHRTLFMHAIQVHHGILYMQLKKGTMTT